MSFNPFGEDPSFVYKEPGGAEVILFAEDLQKAIKDGERLLLSGDWPGIQPGDTLSAEILVRVNGETVDSVSLSVTWPEDNEI